MVLFYLAIVTIASIASAQHDGGNSLFDYIVGLRFGGTASTFVLLIGVFPLIAMIFPIIVDQMETGNVCIKN
ncbi:hypothetical protein A499_03408 [Niallia nealsonii AAU1]|nr:hypothetical protein A499_03408 [Niallia nealsonii AAU1]